MVASAVASARKAKQEPEQEPDGAGPATPAVLRPGTKQAQIIAMLQRPEGASIAEMVEATSWQAHSVRGMMSGVLKRKLGLPVSAGKVEGRGMVYKLPDV